MQLAVEPTDQIQLADMPEIALRVRGLDAAGDDDTNERKTGVGDEIAHASADASRGNFDLRGCAGMYFNQRGAADCQIPGHQYEIAPESVTIPVSCGRHVP